MDHLHSDSTGATTAPAKELFALTDEQIVGLSDSAVAGHPDASHTSSAPSFRAESAEREIPLSPGAATGLTKTDTPQSTDAPSWLADRMRDPQHGEEAKALWDAKQKADAEVAAFREVFATAADARALKEIYPGGLAEAKTAAERARELETIDAAFYRGDTAARAQLAEKMLRQDSQAFREMVEAGVRLLAGESSEKSIAPSMQQATQHLAGAREAAQPTSTAQEVSQSQQGNNIPPDVLRAYGEFEKSANAELEKSVGGAIARVMEQALPNLRLSGANGQEGAQGMAPLRDRLSAAVRDEVDAGLRSDRQLGEQVARVLAGKRFDESVRAQVVRLIDTRAQQLVPGAVRKVVGSWTQATLGAKAKPDAPPAATPPAVSRSTERTQKELASLENAGRDSSVRPGRRVDYRRLSDEQIWGM